ncbi:hypothetical protein HDU80_001768 [Chytriomyces hyalinus]|nr:hypothetical protein HDU80_001768 [Chytriomyces hyalinus]
MQLPSVSIISVLVAFATFVDAATKVATYCNPDKTLCASFAAADKTSVSVFIQTTSVGWVGLGFGSSMSTAAGFVVAGQSGYLSTRDAVNRHAEPPVSSVQTAKALKKSAIQTLFGKVPAVKGRVIKAYYKLPANWFNRKGATSLLYAAGKTAPDSNGQISFHDDMYASFSFDIYKKAK